MGIRKHIAEGVNNVLEHYFITKTFIPVAARERDLKKPHLCLSVCRSVGRSAQYRRVMSFLNGPYTRPYKRPKFELLSGNSRIQSRIIFTSYGK